MPCSRAWGWGPPKAGSQGSRSAMASWKRGSPVRAWASMRRSSAQHGLVHPAPHLHTDPRERRVHDLHHLVRHPQLGQRVPASAAVIRDHVPRSPLVIHRVPVGDIVVEQETTSRVPLIHEPHGGTRDRGEHGIPGTEDEGLRNLNTSRQQGLAPSGRPGTARSQTPPLNRSDTCLPSLDVPNVLPVARRWPRAGPGHRARRSGGVRAGKPVTPRHTSSEFHQPCPFIGYLR
jgi:hypothetical protein